MSNLVMIVEDDPLNMRLFQDLLASRGHKTMQAQTGQDALELLALVHPDLVVLDICLPDLSGLEIISAIKQNTATRHIPILVVTARAMPEEELKIRSAGCDEYLSKPISIHEFIAVVDDMLQSAVIRML